MTSGEKRLPIDSDAFANPARETRRRARLWLFVAVKLAILLSVAAAIHRTLDSAWSELTTNQYRIALGWLVLSGVLYVVGLLPAAWFWYWLLRRFGQGVTLLSTLRAHYIGHLGKYLPGKAMVFVIRIGLLPRTQRAIGPASLAVYYETITMMGVGASLAAVLLPAWYKIAGLPALVAAAMAVGGLIVTLPALLRRLAGPLRFLKRGAAIADEMARIDYWHVIVGWLANLIVWILLGLSFWAALRGLMPAAQVPISDLPFHVAAVALAMVAGFVSLIPGGAFVREAVLLQLLDPRYGAGTAIVAAVALRLVWLLSEVLVSAILYGIGLKLADTASAAGEDALD